MMYFTETEALRELEILMQMIPGFQPNRSTINRKGQSDMPLKKNRKHTCVSR